MSIILDSPLSIHVSGKSKFILNMNNYRNTHYQSLNKAKVNYKAVMSDQILKLPAFEAISLTYILYPKTKRRTDISNVLSIHDKFFCDALVEFKKLPDDNYEYLADINFRFGYVDKENPRVEIVVTEQ